MSKVKREPVLYTANGSKLSVVWVNEKTQKGQQIIRAYNCAKKEDIYQAYKKPSNEKCNAFRDIKTEMKEVGGAGMRITGAGCDVFSCAYKVKDGADFEFIVYHTPSYRYAVLYNLPW